MQGQISQIWHFWIAIGLEIFGFSFSNSYWTMGPSRVTTARLAPFRRYSNAICWGAVYSWRYGNRRCSGAVLTVW